MTKITENPNYIFAEHVLELTKDYTVCSESFQKLYDKLESVTISIESLNFALLSRRPRDFDPKQEPDKFEVDKMNEEFEAAENFINAAVASIKKAQEKAVDLAEVKMRKALDGVTEYAE